MATNTSDALDKELDTVLGGSADIKGAAVLGKDGLLISSSFAVTGHDATRVGAEGAALFGLGSRTLESLKAGQFEQVVLQGDDGMAIVTKAGAQALILALAKGDANLGMALLEVRKLADAVGAIIS